MAAFKSIVSKSLATGSGEMLQLAPPFVVISTTPLFPQAAPVNESINFAVPAALTNTHYHESHGKIKSMIDLLPDEQREVMLLNHYAGLGFNEIAGVMKCSLNKALDIMKFGLNNLRKMMLEEEIVLN